MREKEINEHHHEYTRNDWHRDKVNKLIRLHAFSRSLMYVPIHVELHKHVPPVAPPAERSMGEMILSRLRSLPTRYTSLDAAKNLRDTLYDTDAAYIGAHLAKQIPFLELSKEELRKRVL